MTKSSSLFSELRFARWCPWLLAGVVAAGGAADIFNNLLEIPPLLSYAGSGLLLFVAILGELVARKAGLPLRTGNSGPIIVKRLGGGLWLAIAGCIVSLLMPRVVDVNWGEDAVTAQVDLFLSPAATYQWPLSPLTVSEEPRRRAWPPGFRIDPVNLITYESRRAGKRVIVEPRLPYLEMALSGKEVAGIFYSDGNSTGAFTWEYPRLNVKVLNSGDKPVSLGSLVFRLDEVVDDREPLVYFGDDHSAQRALLIINEGWGPILKPHLELAWELLPTDESQQRARWNQLTAVTNRRAYTIKRKLATIQDRRYVPLEGLPSFPKDGREIFVAVFGRLRYEALGGTKHRILFHTRVSVGGKQAAALLGRSAAYGLLVDVDRPRREYVVPVAHVIPPGGAEAVVLQIGATRSATLRGRVRAEAFDGQVLVDQSVHLKLLVPRTQASKCLPSLPGEACRPQAWMEFPKQATNTPTPTKRVVPEIRISGVGAHHFSPTARRIRQKLGDRARWTGSESILFTDRVIYTDRLRQEADELIDELGLQAFERVEAQAEGQIVIELAEPFGTILVSYTPNNASQALKLRERLSPHATVALVEGRLPGRESSAFYVVGGFSEASSSAYAAATKVVPLRLIATNDSRPLMGHFHAIATVY